LKTKNHHIAGLDLLRFFAASLVLFYHIAFLGGWNALDSASPREPFFPFAQEWFWCGWIGVQIFFVISGFVISNSAMHSTASKFLTGRFLRLMPTLWICATITFAALLLSDHLEFLPGLPLYMRSMILFPYRPWIDGAYWSLCVELAFYALIWVGLKRRSRVETVLQAVGAASIAFWTLYLLSAWAPQPVHATFVHAAGSWITSITLLQYGCFFCFGGMLWLSVSDNFSKSRLIWLSLCLASCLIEITAFTQSDADKVQGHSAYPLSIFLMAVVLIASSYYWSVTRWLVPPLRAAGLITYPLYLLHQQVGHVIQQSLFFAGFPSWLALVATISAVMILAIVVTFGIEPGLAKPIKAGLSRRSPPRPV
jgi:peptidoglycan/LPS O-acetylase OafA/YrhL